MDWVSDASDLLELPIHYVEASKVDITRAEGRRIAERKAVVRWDAESGIAYIVVGLRDDPGHYLYIKADSITRAPDEGLTSLYPGLSGLLSRSGKEYLARIQDYFSYPVSIENVQNLPLDSEQIGRLRLDHSIILYRDNASIRGTTISIISPIPGSTSQVLVMGQVPLFNWMPFQLADWYYLIKPFCVESGCLWSSGSDAA